MAAPVGSPGGQSIEVPSMLQNECNPAVKKMLSPILAEPHPAWRTKVSVGPNLHLNIEIYVVEPAVFRL